MRQENSVNEGFSLAAHAQTILKESLVYYCRSDRYKFLVKCIENIKRNVSIVSSCKLIEDILNSYSDVRSNYENEHKGMMIKNLDKEHHLFSELFTSLLLFKKEAVERASEILISSADKIEESIEESCYTCSSDDDSQGSEERGRKHAEILKNLKVSKDSNLNYFEELRTRLNFLKFLYNSSSETLQLKHAQIL